MNKVISTGFPKLDGIIGSLDRARTIIIAGRPTIGKTAFAVSLARNIAIDQKIPLDMIPSLGSMGLQTLS